MTDREKELVRRLRAFIDDPRASEGELSAAKSALKRIMDKCEVTEPELEKDDRSPRRIFIKTGDCQTVVGQALGAYLQDVLGWSYEECESQLGYIHRERGGEWFFKVNLTVSEFIEAQARADFYWESFQSDRRRLLKNLALAFCCKNDLGLTNTRLRIGRGGVGGPLSEDDRDIAGKSNLFGEHEFRNQIKGRIEMIAPGKES